MNILEINTGLFPDRSTVAAAVVALQADHHIQRIDVFNHNLDDEGWDDLVKAILKADRIVTL